MNEYKPNEIESIVEYQLTKIEGQISLMRQSLERSRQKPNGRAWLQMIADFKELQAMFNRLEMLNINVRCAVENLNPHEGVDG